MVFFIKQPDPGRRKSTFLFPSTFLAFCSAAGLFLYAARSWPNVQGLNKSSCGTIKGFLIVKYCGRISVFVSHSSGTWWPDFNPLAPVFLFFSLSFFFFFSFLLFFFFFSSSFSSWPACVEPTDFLNVEFKIHGIYYNRHGY